MDLNRARFIGSGQIIDEDGNVIDLGKIHSIEYSLDEPITVTMEDKSVPKPASTKAPAKKRPLTEALEKLGASGSLNDHRRRNDGLDALSQAVNGQVQRAVERMIDDAARAHGGHPNDYTVDNLRLDGNGHITGDVRHKMMGPAPTAALPDIDMDFDKLKIWDPNDGSPDPLQNDTDIIPVPFVPGGGAIQHPQAGHITFSGTTTKLPGNVTIDKNAIGYTGNLGGQVVSDFFSSDGKITADDVMDLLKPKRPLKATRQPARDWKDLAEMVALGHKVEDLYLLTGEEEWEGIERASTPYGRIDVRYSEHVTGTEVRVHDRWSR